MDHLLSTNVNRIIESFREICYCKREIIFRHHGAEEKGSPSVTESNIVAVFYHPSYFSQPSS